MTDAVRANQILEQINISKKDENQILEILRDGLNLYQVSLFVVNGNGQSIDLRAATGKLGELLIERRHRFQINDTQSLIGKAINRAEIQAYETKYTEQTGCVRQYRCPSPDKVQLGERLPLELIEESVIRHWKFASAFAPPIGWEVCLPVRDQGQIAGAFDFQAQLLLSSQDKKFWSPAGYELINDGAGVEFTVEACTTLQWLANRLYERYPFGKDAA